MDLSRTEQSQSALINFEANKGDLQIARMLDKELQSKNQEIENLRVQNNQLATARDATTGVFQVVRVVLGEHSLTINDYIIGICLFLRNRGLRDEFLGSIAKGTYVAGESKDD